MSRSMKNVRDGVPLGMALLGIVLGWTAGPQAAAEPVASGSVVLEGGTVHSMVGEPVVADLLLVDGEIRAVGSTVDAPADARRIDVTGKHVYPGFMDAFSRLGLVEIGSVPATVDTTELGSYNPHLTAATAVHPASEVIPVTRESGITHTLTAPAGSRDGGIPGRAAVLHLAGWTVEEMAVDPSAAMVVTWPAVRTRSFDFSTFTFRETPFAEAEKEAKEGRDELEAWMRAARHYAQAEKAGSKRMQRNLQLESLAEVLDGELPVIVTADAERDIKAAVEWCEKQELRFILAGGRDAHKVADLLAEKEIPVILRLPQSLPTHEDDPYDLPFKNAAALASAGVKFAFGSGAGGGFGPGGPHGSRTLPFEAGTAVAYGLPAEEALRALTLYPAQMLGLGDRLGSIEPGKIANLVIFGGNPLEITSTVDRVFIEGREVSTDNRHRRLYEQYRSR